MRFRRIGRKFDSRELIDLEEEKKIKKKKRIIVLMRRQRPVQSEWQTQFSISTEDVILVNYQSLMCCDLNFNY